LNSNVSLKQVHEPKIQGRDLGLRNLRGIVKRWGKKIRAKRVKSMIANYSILFLYLFIIIENPLSFLLDMADVVPVISAAPYMAYNG
jgi:hypothetical protein